MPLLDDEDEQVYQAVKEKIIKSGIKNIPFLKDALGSASTLLQYDRIESMIIQLRMQQIKGQIISWLHTDNKSLVEGWSLISSVQGVEISPQVTEKLVHQITTKIWIELNQHQTSFEKIAIINKIFFDLYCFRVSPPGKTAIGDFFIDKILISGKGTPLTLNMLYAIVAGKLNLPFKAVNIHGRILLGYYDPLLSREAFVEIDHPFLFFIDVENKGRIIGVKEFDFLLKEKDLSINSGILLSNKDILKLLLNQLKDYCTRIKDHEKVYFSEDLLQNFD
jgi:hypothetical protein